MIAVQERVETAPPPVDEDDLVHIFCGPCKRRARARAKRPVPYCGKQMPNRPLLDDDGTLPHCVVCEELFRSTPCAQCGNSSFIES